MAKLFKIIIWAGGWLAVALLVSGMPVLDTGIFVIGFPLWIFALVQIIALGTGYVLSGDQRSGSLAHVVAFLIAIVGVNLLAVVSVDMLSMFTPIKVLAGH